MGTGKMKTDVAIAFAMLGCAACGDPIDAKVDKLFEAIDAGDTAEVTRLYPKALSVYREFGVVSAHQRCKLASRLLWYIY